MGMAELGTGDELARMFLFLSAGLWTTMFHSWEIVPTFLEQWYTDEEPTLNCNFACV